MMKFVLLTSFSFICFVGFSQDAWDLKECIEYAMKNNISVRQTDVQARIAALDVKQNKLYQFPTVGFSAGTGLQSGRSIDPTSNQFTTTQLFYNNMQLQGGAPIFNFGRLKNSIEASKFLAQAAKVDIERAGNDVALNVATYYLQILAANEQIEISKVQIAQTTEQLSVTDKKVQAGALPELNLAEFESQLATDSSNLVTAILNYEQNLLNLKALLNIDAGAAFDIEKPPVELIPLDPLETLQPEYVYAKAVTTQPLQRATSLRILGAQKFVQASKAAMLPSLSGFYSFASTFNNKALGLIGTVSYSAPIGKVTVNGADYEVFSNEPFTQPIYGKTTYFNQLNQNFSQAVGLSLSVPIFNNGTARLGWERSRLDLQNIQLQEEQNNVTLKTNIYNAYVNATASMEKYLLGKKTVASAQKAYDFATRRYEVGLLTSIDLLITQNQLLTAKLQQIVNQYDYVFKMKVLEFYKGEGLKL